MRDMDKSRPIILSARTDTILRVAAIAINFFDRFGIFEINNKEKNAKVKANMSL
jgi:hypothetical protein